MDAEQAGCFGRRLAAQLDPFHDLDAPPIVVQFLTGTLGCIPSDIDHLIHLKRTAGRLFGESCELFTHGTGPLNLLARTFGSARKTACVIGLAFRSSRMPIKSGESGRHSTR